MRHNYAVIKGFAVPAISMFYGIIIKMFFSDHNPPHLHAEYAEYMAQFDFDGSLIKGEMPNRQRKLIEAWIELHSDELRANWKMASEGGTVEKIAPLK